MTDAPSSSSTTPNNATTHRNLTIKPFIMQTDSNDTAENWQKYKEEIERQFRFFGINDPETKKDGLLIYGGQDLIDIGDALPDLNAPKDLLNITPRYETLQKCEYADHEDDAIRTIRDHLIRTMLNHKIRNKAVRENWAFDRILTETTNDEQTTEQADAINKKINEETAHERIKKLALRKPTRHSTTDDACGRCGNSKKHTTCPAIGVSCDTFGKKNHYARVCFGKTKHNIDNRNQIQRLGSNRYRSDSKNIRDKRDYRGDDKREMSQTRRTRDVGDNCSDDSSSDDERFMNHFKTHHTSQDNADKWKTCTIQINGINIVAEPDSGSDTNIMDESQFAHLREQAPERRLKIRRSYLKLLKRNYR
ncbi:Hypothetical predicted protein [Paramuricea clavata]|uniref:Uncharacterized protein n=1 Tax=Paramuricea clavata TaxID=317549 RepID=A0A6S7JXB9_PARCT|nr:Hypothetical predicted protein [Paramuricea clavata]